MLKIDVLPDFPKPKAELLRLVAKRVADIEKLQHPILAQIKALTQYEGTSIQFDQVDFGKKMQQAEHLSVRVETRFDEIPTLFGELLDKKLRQIAEQSGALKMKVLFSRIDEATEQTGQKLDAKGRPLDARMLLDMIDMAEAGFDSSGKRTNSFVVHPNLIPALKKASEEVESDPELKQRLESINRRQYQRWLDRENRRKLVD